MYTFKEGDRVKINCQYGGRPAGTNGTVTKTRGRYTGETPLVEVTLDPESDSTTPTLITCFDYRLVLLKPFKVGDTVVYNQDFGSRVKGEEGVITHVGGDTITIRHETQSQFGSFISSPYAYRVDLVEPKPVEPKAVVTLAPDRYIMETVVATADSIFPRRSFDTILKSLMEEVGELSTEIAIEQGTKKRAASVDGVKGEAIDVFVVAVDMLRAAWGKELCTPAFNEAVIRKLNKWEGK
ncbi:hypothetical protein CNR37_00070 [Pseudomonas phage ventosus]|uniref:Uncharacterized protein n=1 Tax=Pseudomonas phage ventosus TaxID=2048980 RepID=A0A2H4P7X5_9CAUD|nr:hypothetical protein CNR37_00070 [Pseudomonas phage ventosus]